MKRFRKNALLVLAALVVIPVAYAALTRLVSPISLARADSYRVWIALLKGFEGDVHYVGSHQENAYFRIGYVFRSFYRVPACAARLPEVFSVDTGNPYVVRLHVHPDNTIHSKRGCAQQQDFELGDLDRGLAQ